MIETIITDYLRQNRRLVIPGLGAFLKKESGETVFVPFLNKDDGVLTGLVSRSYGTSAAEAEGIAAQWVDNVRGGIARSGGYLVATLGSLKPDANGTLFLDAADRAPRPVRKPEVPVVVEEHVVKEERLDEPVAEPDIEAEALVEELPAYVPPAVAPEPPRTVAESVDAPRTLNDLIRERQELTEEAPKTFNERIAEARPVSPRPAPRKTVQADTPTVHLHRESKVIKKPVAPPEQKKGDWVLIAAIAVAIVAVIVLAVAYATNGLPTFDLR